MTTLLTTRTAIAHYTGGAVTKYQEQAVNDATKRAYASDFRHFTARILSVCHVTSSIDWAGPRIFRDTRCVDKDGVLEK